MPVSLLADHPCRVQGKIYELVQRRISEGEVIQEGLEDTFTMQDAEPFLQGVEGSVEYDCVSPPRAEGPTKRLRLLAVMICEDTPASIHSSAIFLCLSGCLVGLYLNSTAPTYLTLPNTP